MADKKILKPFIRSWEGGYVNHPNDKGGATKWGVTIGTFRSAFGSRKTVTDLKNMTEEQWDAIFDKMFWSKCKADGIVNQSIANLIVDWYWGSGKWGIVYAQIEIGVPADGIIGPKTLAAINNADQSELFAKLWRKRKAHFESLAKQKGQSIFLSGWLNRLNGIKWGRLVCNGGRTITF